MQAKPAILDKTDRVANDWKNVFEDAVWKKIPYDKDDFREIINSMSEWGDGARCEICVAWDERNGHTFCAEQIDGRTVFHDPQNSEKDAREYFFSLVKGSTIHARIDKLIPSKMIKECCFPV